MRRSIPALLLAAVLFATMALGCDSPVVVDCTPGRFARTSVGAWCVFPATSVAPCPDDLPVEHALPWGGRGCALEMHSPIPDDLCVNAGVCTGDAGP